MAKNHEQREWFQSLDPAVTRMTRVGMPIDQKGKGRVDHCVLIGVTADPLSTLRGISLRLEASADGAHWAPVVDDAHVGGGSVDAKGEFAMIDNRKDTGLIYSISYEGSAPYSRVQVAILGRHEKGTPIAALASRMSDGGRPFP